MEEKKEEFKFDINTFIFTVLILYKLNMISRDNLRGVFEKIKEPLPENPLQWLVKEAARG